MVLGEGCVVVPHKMSQAAGKQKVQRTKLSDLVDLPHETRMPVCKTLVVQHAFTIIAADERSILEEGSWNNQRLLQRSGEFQEVSPNQAAYEGHVRGVFPEPDGESTLPELRCVFNCVHL